MSLVTYEQARPWAGAIRKEVAAKRMPPFHADGPVGYYKDDIRLTPEELDTILDWVDGGVPRGNPADQPEPRTWTNVSWPLGEPDLVIDFPRVTPRTDNNDDWWSLFSDYIFPEDTWIRGIQLRADEQSIIHHAHILVMEPHDEIPEGGISQEKTEVVGHQPVETWFPGFKCFLLPADQGMVIKKGCRLAIQIHFGPNTAAVSTKPAVGLYYANGTINSAQATLGGAHVPIDIPPFEPAHVIRTSNTFKVDGTITHFRNHMHVRGKSAQIVLHYPDGKSEVVFDIPKFNFDWQRYYFLAEPKRVPAGTVAEFIGTWDNSTDNPLNPDPAQRVHIGFRTADEMFGTKLFYTPDFKMPMTYLVKDGRVVESHVNPDAGPWLVFWNQVVSRKELEAAIAQAQSETDGAATP